ncbi:ATP-binding protein [Arcticibacter sp.]|uniref:sensor histidine kinase n=1 Tax=Arcticibacter sp. TaxID=1872630 RepID=UPI00388D4CE6
MNELYRKAPVGIFFMNKDFVVYFANEAMCKVFNKESVAEIEGENIFDLLPDLEGDQIYNLFRNVIDTGESFVDKELAVSFSRNGRTEISYYDVLVEPVRNQRNEIIGVVNISVELTEQVVNRKRLEESQHRLGLAIEANKLGIWEFDLINNTSIRSARYDEIFGYENGAPSWWGREDFVRHITEEDLPIYRGAFQKALLHGEMEAEVRIVTAQGTMKWIGVRGVILKNDDGIPVKAIGITVDVTERKKQETQKDEFISIVSHELKTPITSVKAYTQILQRELSKLGDPKISQMFDRMDKQLNKLTGIIYDLLDVTHMEGGKVRYNHTEFSFNELLDEVVSEIQVGVNTHHIRTIKEGQDRIHADRERISQVLVNLITNAIKYSPKASEIIIRTYPSETVLLCGVQDFGFGISDEMKTKLFEKFYRIHNTQHSTVSGLGLGLYITREILKRQNGNIWVNSKLGEGSEFIFELPLKIS